jgi:hypothetical protein
MDKSGSDGETRVPCGGDAFNGKGVIWSKMVVVALEEVVGMTWIHTIPQTIITEFDAYSIVCVRALH